MTSENAAQSGSPITAAAALRPLTIDEMAAVRHLQVSAVRRFAVSHLSDQEMQAFVAYLESPAYNERMATMAQTGRLIAATVMDDVVATGGWVAANDSGSTARLVGVFVSPYYAGEGLGRMVVEEVEAQARRAGYESFSVRAPIGSVGFFMRIGYDVVSHGVWPLPPDQPLPVGFLRKSVFRSPSKSA